MDILQFAEAVHLDLTPVQRVVLKLFYGIPLDSTVLFEVLELDYETLRFNRETFTEASYANFLGHLGRLHHTGGPASGLCLVAGRRSGKDTLLALINAFEVYSHLEEPFQVPHVLGLLSHSLDYSQMFLDLVREFALAFEPLSSRAANNAQRNLSFQTSQDILETGTWVGSQRSAKASLTVAVLAANRTSVRGRTFLLLTLSDVPDATIPELCLRTLSERIAIAGTPSSYGESYLRSEFENASGALRIQVPTWHMRPDVFSVETLEKMLSEYGAPAFVMEYGAEFLDKEVLLLPPRRGARLNPEPWLVQQDHGFRKPEQGTSVLQEDSYRATSKVLRDRARLGGRLLR